MLQMADPLVGTGGGRIVPPRPPPGADLYDY
jgi:hypothetical protein